MQQARPVGGNRAARFVLIGGAVLGGVTLGALVVLALVGVRSLITGAGAPSTPPVFLGTWKGEQGSATGDVVQFAHDGGYTVVHGDGVTRAGNWRRLGNNELEIVFTSGSATGYRNVVGWKVEDDGSGRSQLTLSPTRVFSPGGHSGGTYYGKNVYYAYPGN